MYDPAAPLSQDERARRKAEVMAQFRADYEQLKASWHLDPARLRLTDDWVAHANNASFGAQAAYDDLVPAFEALFESLGGDWTRFYDEAKRLAKLPKDERHRILESKEAPRA